MIDIVTTNPNEEALSVTSQNRSLQLRRNRLRPSEMVLSYQVRVEPMLGGVVRKSTQEAEAKVKYRPARVQIPDSLKEKLTPKKIADIERSCLEDYDKSLIALEEAIADVALNSEEVNEFMTFSSMRLLELIEVYAEVLAEDGAFKGFLSDDPDLRVYMLLAKMLNDMHKLLGEDAGQTGTNALALKRVLTEGNIRERMCLFQSIRDPIMIELKKHPEHVEKINAKLRERGKDWKIEENLPAFDNWAGHVRIVREKGSDIFREKRPVQEREALRCEMVPTHRMARSQERVPLSEREARYALRIPVLSKVTDEELDKPIFWTPGAAYWKSLSPSDIDQMRDEGKILPERYDRARPIIDAIRETRMVQMAGISGSADIVLSTFLSMGIATLSEMYLARLACMGWLIDLKAHSALEVGVVAQSYGVPFVLSPTYYNDIVPPEMEIFHEKFLLNLEIAQKERGHELPDHYLSESYVLTKARALGFVE